MGLLDQILANDAAAFVDTDGFGETITVGDGTTEWTVNAVVDRNPPTPANGNAQAPSLSITLPNHPTLGIDITAFNAGKYYVKLGTDTAGDSKKIMLHGKPTSQDAGMLTFEV